MPERIFVHKEAKSTPSFKALKDRIAVMLGINVAGCKMKLFGKWRSENSKPCKPIREHTLAVHCRSHQKRRTQLVFPDALLNCCACETENDIFFKILSYRIMFPNNLILLVTFISTLK